jgi:hypothetical protein
MTDADEFVTVLRSSNAQHIDSVIALFDAEGIPYEHPGKNHAALLPGLTYIEVQLRVPMSRADEALALLRDVQDDSTARFAFRVRRTQETTGAFGGMAIGMVLVGTAHGMALNPPPGTGLAILAASSILGYAFGKSKRRDMCSLPNCAQMLPRSIDVCPKCRSKLQGEVQTSAEHFAALEALERPGESG